MFTHWLSPEESCVADVLAHLKSRLGEKVTPGADLRLLELFYSKIYKVSHRWSFGGHLVVV